MHLLVFLVCISEKIWFCVLLFCRRREEEQRLREEAERERKERELMERAEQQIQAARELQREKERNLVQNHTLQYSPSGNSPTFGSPQSPSGPAGSLKIGV